MRKTQSIEVVGIGNFNSYPISVKKKEYNKVNERGEKLSKKILEPSHPAKYVYVDDKGTEYSDDRVFTDFNGLIIQGIKRTEKVKNFSIVDINEISNLTEIKKAFLETDLTTAQIYNDKIGEGKAICFKLHKSSVGFEFYKAYITKINGLFVMFSGEGDFNEAQQDFKNLLMNKERSDTEIVVQKVEVKADEIEELLNKN